MSRLNRKSLAVLVAASLLAFSACAAEQQSESAASKAGVSKADCIAEATKGLDAARAEVPLMEPESPFDMSVNEGKSIWLITVVANESSTQVFEGLQAATKATGMSVHQASANGQVTQMQKLVREAVTAGADGIVLYNVEPGTVSEAIDLAEKEGVTIVDFNTSSPTDPLAPGIFAHVAFDMAVSGKAKADWMLVDSGCDLDVAVFRLPTYKISTNLIDATKEEIDRLCADCKVVDSDVNIATLATSLSPLVSTVLRRNPSTGYIDPGFDTFVGFVTPAIEQLNSDAKILGHDGLPSNLKAMRAGSTNQAATAAVPSMNYIAWALLDQLGRGMAGEEAATWAIPSRLIDTTNIGQSDAEIFPAFQEYEPVFLEAWGLS